MAKRIIVDLDQTPMDEAEMEAKAIKDEFKKRNAPYCKRVKCTLDWTNRDTVHRPNDRIGGGTGQDFITVLPGAEVIIKYHLLHCFRDAVIEHVHIERNDDGTTKGERKERIPRFHISELEHYVSDETSMVDGKPTKLYPINIMQARDPDFDMEAYVKNCELASVAP
jgi:hypothetical protein